ncbi:type II toxin-antitoxin system PrlF family antitoxin [Lentilactobacillus farraginis]|uniref:SpoVT-AbrB domain-containing protein n=1 Tax=Lentilactobacillus farraginis DSM 18382 = JCM 14108 TaxID=1423743 RepID=X0QGV8_9LACO|nr:type II toxin-antitoxin system PrlF family antitoxin [Lentilactobacillus farraginis]KRM06650.1 hypothetical protein FD41_GL000529 [Lentilactobacillus farraginis DSM 18382 = JCM 14108]GAF37860.1 hypothetical protein JCM14108_2942 [Lentilactobacillus farraginis DSM 18382 = JCM 14108]
MNTTSVKAILTSKKQVTIPKTIREILKINSHDTIDFEVLPNNEVRIKSANPSLWETMREQEKVYGNVSTDEVDWGKNIESEDFDK